MQSIKLKIMNYDEVTGSLIVTFASDKAENPIDHYPACAYQPTMYDTQDPEKVLKEIARAGIHVANQQDKEEAFKNDPELKAAYKNLIGKEFEFNVSELLANTGQIVESMQEVSMLDEILTEINLDEDDS
jgi:hypothetical protein